MKTKLLSTALACCVSVAAMQAGTTAGPFIDPHGTVKEYTRTGEGFYTAYSGAILTKSIDRLAATVVENEEGELFFSHPFVSLRTDCFLKGVIEGERIKMTFPQVAYVSSPEKTQSLYVMEFVSAEDGTPNYKVSDQQTLYMNVSEDGVYTLELPDYDPSQEYPLQIIGLCGDDEEWDGFGEYQMSYIPFTDKKTIPPSGLETEEWAFKYSENGYSEGGTFVKVGFDEEDNMYIQGFSSLFPEAWIVGKIEGEDVIFESAQYVGFDTFQYYHCYFFGGKIEDVYDPEWNDFYPTPCISPSLVMHLDIDRKALLTDDDNCIIINTNKETTLSVEQFWYISFVDQPVDIDLTPQEPYNPYYSPDFGMGFCSISFNLSMYNQDNDLLHTDNLYYRIYLDDDLYTLYPDVYQYLSEEITEIPFAFNCGSDIQAYGSYHNINLYAEGISTIGIQAVYIDINGAEHTSAVVTYDIESGNIVSATDLIISTKSLISVKYYDIQGRRIEKPVGGLCIIKKEYSDGTSSTEKIFSN